MGNCLLFDLLLKLGNRMGDPFCCACARSNDVFFHRRWIIRLSTSTIKGSPKQCPGFSNVFLLVFVKDKRQALLGCIQMASCFTQPMEKTFLHLKIAIFYHINFCQSRKRPLILVTLVTYGQLNFHLKEIQLLRYTTSHNLS